MRTKNAINALYARFQDEFSSLSFFFLVCKIGDYYNVATKIITHARLRYR